MTIQPSSLEVAHLVNRDPSTGLGLIIKATFEGHLIIIGTKEGSISSKIRRLTPGDEVVAVAGQTVVGWQLPKLVATLKRSPNDVSIMLKKCPHFSSGGASATPTSRRHQERVLTVAPPISPIRKVADSRKNSADTIDEGMSTSDMSRHASQENLASPKKSSGKKKKLKKQKAKSSSNILATATEGTKKSSNRSSGNSFGSSIDGSLRSASSSEAMLSVSTGNLTKNFDLRKSLEKALRRERGESTENVINEPKQKKLSESKDRGKNHKKGQPNYRKKQQEMMPNVNDVLEELRTKRLKKQEDIERSVTKEVLSESHQSELPSKVDEPMAIEPPSSPLDILTIPPPPEAPYTPRTENVLQVVTDEDSLPSSGNPTYSASESPNSVLDTEHRRRFTVIGSEQMDDKWFNSLLSEVNAKRAKRTNKASARQVLERLDETTASDDSVFASRSLLTETETPPKMRPPKPKRRNRPVSMPPNYYSPSKLSQYRIPQGAKDVRSGSLLKILNGEPSPVKTSRISSVAHQVDENGVKKLAPLNCSIENVTTPASDIVKANSLDNRGNIARRSPAFNFNNSNSAGRRSNYKTPPKPPRRSLSITERSTPLAADKPDANMPVGRVKETGERLKLNLKFERPKSTSDEAYAGLLQVKPRGASTPSEPLQVARRPRSRTEISSEAPTPTRLDVANELNKYFLRKTGVVSSSSDPFSPVPSPMWTENDAFLPKSQTVSATSPAKAPLMPPKAKPRTKIVSSPIIKEPIPPKNEINPADQTRKNRSKSVDSAEALKTSTTATHRRQSEGLSIPERSASKLSRTSPTSRGSYVAAMDDGFSYENMLKEAGDGSYERDSRGYSVTVVDGVTVRLRKSTGKSRGKKKTRLKIVDQLKGSPDMRSSRRISCRDLGSGECNGWLWKKKHNSSPLSSKWSKRWVVLKEGALYCYHTEDDEKAESYISLPGYKVTPALECKRKFAFRVSHPHRKTFYFASDRQLDMSRWMNKMGLAAIEYGFGPSAKDPQSNASDMSKDEENYYSESESEDASLSQGESGQNTSQSGTESSTPSSSPEKTYRHTAKPQYTTASNSQSASRHMSTQPDLNRSARFPKNKAVTIAQATGAATQSTQTSDSLSRNAARNRSKSEAAVSTSKGVLTLDPTNSQNTEDDGSTSPSTSPRKKPVVSAQQRKHKAKDTRRKLETGYLSTSLETVHATRQPGLRSSHSEEELRHLRKVAVRKAEEVAQREKYSNTSLASTTSAENPQLAADRQKAKGRKSPVINESKGDANDGSRSPNSQPRVIRRDVAGRPKLKVDAGETPDTANVSPTNAAGSLGSLCKALDDADVDIHGVNRRRTLRRKMTILAKDPKRNELMLKKRALQRQVKALESELEYYNVLLDEKDITSEMIHKWINQHPSLFADLGTIRRMSKRRKTLDKDKNGSVSTTDSSEKDASSELSGQLSAAVPASTDVSVPIPAKRGVSSTPTHSTIEIKVSTGSNHQRKHSDTDVPSAHSTIGKQESLGDDRPKVRPRSCAVSSYDVDKMKSNRNKSPTKVVFSPSVLSPNRRPYLETDL